MSLETERLRVLSDFGTTPPHEKSVPRVMEKFWTVCRAGTSANCCVFVHDEATAAAMFLQGVRFCTRLARR